MKEQVFIDLTIEDNGYEDYEEESRFRNHPVSEEQESSLMESSSESESLVSNIDDDGQIS